VNLPVATFTDAGGAEAAANYTATIDWGDGTTPSQGTITAMSPGASGFTVSGSHTYHLPGADAMTVTIDDDGGATATAASTAIVGSDDERFIENMFRELLGRDVDDGGLSFLTALLSEGHSRTEVVQVVTSSAEFRADEVQGLFRLFLHRPAEQSAVDSFTAILSHGGTMELAATDIVASSEYFQVRGGGTRDGFLDALYADVFHRGVDPAGRSFWDRLPLSDESLRVIAATVFASDEFLGDLVGATMPRPENPFHDPLLDGYFQVFLGRNPDPATLTSFVHQLNAGVRDELVIAELIGSG
jgi:hypothetical protein